MDIERVLITKILSSGQIEEALSKGLRNDLFADDECRDAFEFIKDHARRYKSCPSVTAFQSERPDFKLEYVEESIQYSIDQFLRQTKRRKAQEMVVELAELTQNPKEADNLDAHFLETSRRLATLVPSTEVNRFKDMEQRIRDYEEKAKEGKPVGIPFGFPSLDGWTGGIQPHEFVTVSGWTGTGKSTLLMAIAFNMWSQGKTPLFISLEMEAKALLRRFDSMAASFDYEKAKQLQMPQEQLENWRETAEKIKESAGDIPVIDNLRNCTPDKIFAETVRHDPDVVIVDYISLMQSGRPYSKNTSMWQNLTDITQDLKQNARILGVPVVAAAQTNRAGAKEGSELDNIAYSVSINQDSDIVLGLYSDKEMKENKEMEIRLNKNRDGRIGQLKAVWDFDEMDFREKDMSDMFTRHD